MRVQVTPHIRRKIANGSDAIARQFELAAGETNTAAGDDPLGEEARYSPVKGLVHKFPSRVLWKLTYRCAAHCRFCTRIRQIGNADGDLSRGDINAALDYIRAHSEITDVILSGGDPLYVPNDALAALQGLGQIPTVKVVRIGTRMPIHSPSSMHTAPIRRILDAFSQQRKRQQPYVLVHANHPDELDDEVVLAMRLIQSYGLIVLVQTVFLKNINDATDILERLFVSLYRIGAIPYYIYRCDRVAGLERFICDVHHERSIMTELHRRLSGIAVPRYIADVPGRGKLPFPLLFWNVPDINSCVDFDGRDTVIT